MAHQYSVEIHTFITERLKETEAELEKLRSSGEESLIRKREGQREELLFFRDLLSRKYDLENRKYF